MNGPFVVAQATGAVSGSGPKTVVKVVKPTNNQSVTLQLSYDGSVKLDLTGVANEKITLVHIGERLIILFDNSSTVTVQPFFDSLGNPLPNITVEVADGRDLPSVEFASTFPITNDQTVLPAAGEGGPSAPSSGASFNNVGVDPLGLPTPLPLLGPEELPGFTFSNISAPILTALEAPIAGSNPLVQLDDDDVFILLGNPGGPGDDAAPLNATGTLQHNYNLVPGGTTLLTGATVPGTGGFTVAVGADGLSLTISQDGTPVLRVVLSNTTDGAYTVTQLAPLHHPAGDFENNLPFTIQYQVTTSVGSANGELPINVDDDSPVALASPQGVHATVLEDGLSTLLGDAGDKSEGNRESGETLTSDEASGLAGSLTTLVSVGADAPATFSLSTNIGGLPTLFSHGEQLSYLVAGNTLTGSTSFGTAFTLTVNANGSWTFDLDDQLDHVAGGGENFALRTSASGSTSVGAIDFSSLIVTTDADGDSITGLATGAFTIAVQDDVPVQVGGGEERPFVLALVLEDGLSTTLGDAGDKSEGNREGGETLSSDEASGLAGSLTALISVGSDEPLSWSLSSATSGLPTLFSHGEQLSYQVAGNTLTASTSFGTVFTLTVNADGSWTFDLDDQLDHVDDHTNSENFALRTAADGSTSVFAIDFSSLVVATDADGDSLNGLRPGSFAIAVQDDIPVHVVGEGENLPSVNAGEVFEDGLSTGNPEGAPGSQPTTVTITAAQLSNFVSVGADEPATFSLNSAVGNPLGLTSENEAVTYSVSGDTLTATAGSRTVFTLVDNHNGTFTFTLLGELDHLPLGLGGGDSETLTINLASAFLATNSDGDTIGLIGNLNILVENDIPVVLAAPSNLVIDGDFRGATGDFPFPGGWGGADGGYDQDGILGWTVVASPTNPAATVQIERVGDGYLGMHSSTLGPMIDMAASPGNIEIAQTFSATNGNALTAGQTYAIQFEAGAPFPATAELEIYWGTTLIGTIDPTGPMTSYNYIVTATGSDQDRLTFREVGDTTGDGGLHGTYLANVAVVATAVVDEDGLTGPLSFGNHDSQTGDAVVADTDGDNNEATATGTLGIQWGADNANIAPDVVNADGSFIQDGVGSGLTGRAVYFTDATVGVSGGIPLTSHGEAVTIVLSDDNTHLVGVAGGREVFDVTLSDDGSGSYRFILEDQLDHAANGDENDITLTFHYTARDFDGDTVNGVFLVGVDDDEPTLVGEEHPSFRVDEGDILNLQSQGTSPNDGNGDGSYTGSPADNLVGPAYLTGTVGAGVVSFGADEPGTFSFTTGATGAVSTLAALGLTSKGGAVRYVLNGDTLTAFVDVGAQNGTLNNFDRVVFTLRVDASNGDFEFRLFDQLDHVLGGGHNTALQGTNGPVASLDFGSLILATDSDGDSIALTGALSITVTDDTPTVNIVETGASTTIDETAGLQNDDTTSANVANLFVGHVANTGSDPDIATPIYARNGTPAVLAGSLLGTDEPRPVVLSLAIDGGDGVDSGLATTAGQAIHLFLQNGLIVGRFDSDNSGTVDSTDQAAFAVAIDQSGRVSVAQYVSLQHSNTSNPDDRIDLDGGPLSLGDHILAVATAADFDGDIAVTQTSIGEHVRFDDDGPSVSSGQATLTVDEDGLTGGNIGDSYSDLGDYPGAATTVNGTLSYSFGADGAGTVANDIVFSTAGLPALSSGGVLLVYSYDTASNTLTATAGVTPVFTLHVTNVLTGAYTFTLLAPLDHPVVNTEDDITINFGFSITDGDGDAATGSVAITIDDDAPLVAAAPTNLVTNGDFSQGTWVGPFFWGSYAQPGDVPGWTISEDPSYPPPGSVLFERPASGYLGLTTTSDNMIDLGGSPGNYQLSQTINGLTNGQTIALEFEVGAPFPGTALLQVLWGTTVIGTIDTSVSSGPLDHYAYTVVATGDPLLDRLTFREIGTGTAPLPPPSQDEGFHGTYIANVQAFVVATVDEDGLSNGNHDVQIGDAPGDNVTVSGALGILWGADNADVVDVGGVQDGALTTLTGRTLTFTNNSVLVDGTGGPALTSNGDVVSFVVSENGTVLTGVADLDGSHQRNVFEVRLSDDGTGSYTFTLLDHLDHADGGNENDITLAFGYTARDADGDTQTGTFLVGVDDDEPTLVGEEHPSFRVDEGDILNLQSQGTSPNDGNGDGSYTGSPADNLVGPAYLTGTVGAGVVSFGADEPGTFSFMTGATGAASTLAALGLTSKGGAVRYVLNGDTLTAFVDVGAQNGTLNNFDRVVFTLRVDAESGDFEFRLFDQLDHVLGGGHNTALQGINGPVASLDFGSLILATDSDGDSIALTGALTITVTDDTPTVNIVETGASTTIDETAGLQNDDTTSANVANLFVGHVANTGSDSDIATPIYARNGTPVVLAGSLLGTDEPRPVVLSLAIDGGDGVDSGLATTAGQAIHLFLQNGLIVGRFDSDNSGTVDSTDQAAFAVAIDQSGRVSVAQYVSLQHSNTSNPDDRIDLDGGPSLGDHILAVATATDFDGDVAVTQTSIGEHVRFDDDGPSVSSGQTTLTVDEDGLTGGNIGDSYLDGGDVAGFTTSVNGTLSYSFGADGVGTVANDIVFSTAGLPALSSGGVSLIYNYDTTSNTLTATAGVTPVFTLHVTNVLTGAYTFALLAPLDHPEANTEDDITINFGFSITDGDGDAAAGSVAITIDDDAPLVAAAPTNLVIDGDFRGATGDFPFPGGWGGADGGYDQNGILGWTVTASPTNPAATVQIERVGDGYLGMHSSTLGPMIDMAASPGNIQISQTFSAGNGNALTTGQTYAIQFEAGAPFPLTAELQILWGNTVIGTIHPSGPGALTSYNYIVTATGDAATDQLTFREVGDVNGDGGLHGTYLANVAVVATAIVDEDGLTGPSAFGNHDSQVGDAVVANTDGDNNEATTTGTLGILWGADNGNIAPDVVNANGSFIQDGAGSGLTGRAVYFTDGTVGVSGGIPLTSDGVPVTIVLSADNTHLIGVAGERQVFDVTLSDDGTGSYRFILTGQLDHAANGDENDITLTFHFTARDFDGDTVNGVFLVGVDDDVPVAIDDTPVTVAQDLIGTVGGNVLTNDKPGADGATLTAVDIGNGFQAVAVSGVTTLSNAFGTYTFQADGTWTFDPAANPVLGSNVIADFNYRITDHDGDTSVALQPITLTPAVNDPPSGTDNTISLTEDVTHVFQTSEFGFSDSDGNAFSGVVINTIPAATAGQVLLGNVAVVAGQFISIEAINAGMLTYAPVDDVIGAPGSTSFTFSVRDDGSSTPPSVNTDPTPNTMTLAMSATDYADTILGNSSQIVVTRLVDINHSYAETGGTADVVRLDTASGGSTVFNDLDFSWSDNNLEVSWTVASGSKVITLLNQFSGGSSLFEFFNFDEGGSYAGFGLGSGNYNLFGGLTGGSGNDIIAGSGASETLTGGNGTNLLFGNGGNDTLNGGANTDLLVGGLGNDALNGGGGNDTYVFNLTDGVDTISDSGGIDRIVIQTHGQALSSLSAVDDDNGSSSGDLVIEYNGQQITVAGHHSGSNNVESIAFDGGMVYGYSLGTGDYTISSADPAGSPRVVSVASGDNFIAGEDGTANAITGGTGRDLMFGGSQADTLNGGGNDDLLVGGGGDDTLTGGAGNDWAVGGAGADHHVMTAPTEGLDHIIDFSGHAGDGDVLDFSNVAFGSLGVGTLDASHFGSGASVTDGTFGAGGQPGFWYSTTNNTLYYDSNGNAGGGLTALAVLENGAALDHADIRIVA